MTMMKCFNGLRAIIQNKILNCTKQVRWADLKSKFSK